MLATFSIWTGTGIVGTVVAGIALPGEPAWLLRFGCIGLLLAGMIGLKLGTP